ncbi:aldehyde dehydrogenase family protein [Diaphorobacter caeni]|uniref:aldehyde dehydrogenase family protein n=1 Tax=Diaphorobacter caeni TaxID=2784387 RepID=UPI00188E85DE|nr:aldehyde dehydrogenase family protein [Diaphorobacter caeni]MBF5007495.1 aldehyde dehydrogenase family protein [Diaphorobacter caeni]
MTQFNQFDAIAALQQAQKKAFIVNGAVSADVRQQRLQQVIDLLVECQDELCAAMGEDFGGRPVEFSLANDVLGSLASLKHARDHFREWIGDSPRESVKPFDMFGATAWVKYQPKGVVGVIGTWNAPVFTLLSPLACIFAAGNSAVLKPSEIAPRTAAVLADAIAKRFDPAVLTVVQGDAAVSAAFAEQAWDHLVFTGSIPVGKSIMAAAAKNLVPVTLELGGKSPVLIGESADIANAAERIAVGKALNSGQLCVAPDTIWVHASQLEALIAKFSEVYAGMYPSVTGNRDMTPIVNERHLARVSGYVADAKARGARVVEVGQAAGEADRRLPFALVVNPPLDAEISRHEIFGPAVVLRTFDSIQNAVAQINAGDRPLALYYFGTDVAERDWVLDHTLSGGVSINDVTMHPALHEAPFGGVGASGMGHYHGREGFLQFSHARSVYSAGGHDPRREWGMLPPYGEHFLPMLKSSVTA